MAVGDSNTPNVEARGDVVIRDVGPRDGLQSFPTTLDPAQRIEMIEALARTGLRRIEAGAFVSTRAVPQMANSDQVLHDVRRDAGLSLEVLVVNAKGAQRAVEAGADALVQPVNTSETFSQRNVRMSVDEALAEARVIAEIASEAGVRCVPDVTTVFGCAYEGRVPDTAVLNVIEQLVEIGITETFLCDTTGMGAPHDVTRIVTAVQERWGEALTIGLHFHNTRGLALVNVQAGLQAGVRLFDASVGGLGGCPFSPGATGNVATEDVVHFLTLSGFETGIDLSMLIDVAKATERVLDTSLPSHVMKAGPAWEAAVAHAR